MASSLSIPFFPWVARLGRPRATEEAKRGPKTHYLYLLAVSGPEKASEALVTKT